MKKSLLALAVLGAFAGAASAQSSVTLYGTVDLAGTYVKNDGSNKRLSLSQDGINSSQLGFRGIEDLGGGLKAGFNLLAGVNADTGTANGKFWNRRSTVSLFSGAGELRLGRDYTPTFWNQTIFDPFGTNGIGSSLNPRQLYAGTRMDNTVGYFLPSNIGGFYGQAMVAAAEGGTSGDRAARYYGGRIGFAAGPFDVSGAYSNERFAVGSAISSLQGGGQVIGIAAGNSQKTWNVGGSYDFGFLKLMGYYDHESIPTASEKMFSVGAVIPFGQSEVHLRLRPQQARPRRRGAGQHGRPVQGHVPVQPVQADGDVRHDLAPGQQGRHAPDLASGQQQRHRSADGQWHLEGLPARRASLLLIRCSPRASFSSEYKKAAFGRLFSCRVAPGHSPLTLGAPFAGMACAPQRCLGSVPLFPCSPSSFAVSFRPFSSCWRSRSSPSCFSSTSATR